jgi:hypothetical protein
VTIREREGMTRVRVAIDGLRDALRDQLEVSRAGGRGASRAADSIRVAVAHY